MSFQSSARNRWLIPCFLVLTLHLPGFGQSDERSTEGTWEQSEAPTYHPSRSQLFDLVHTKLELSFDWENQHVFGSAQLMLRPYFFEQETLVLDAKGMDLHKISLVDDQPAKDLEFEYDGESVSIQLDKAYRRNDTLRVSIKYTAKPNERSVGGSDAIKSDKGLYFINPLGEDKNKPRQIWTQGETESNSVWFPTIDAPNQRCTQEMLITVRNEFKTVSNGILVESTNNGNGTRTDYWKMDQPHAPYLFMLVVGEFAVMESSWGEIPLTYYVEPEYEQYADDIFGNTPEMMSYFSDLLEYPYPWPKYAQVVVRDYVSGAMENTSASIFMESLQVTDRELLDYNWDDIIAHELFHQWFGDLVTCESWSNLTLNEGLATYGEYLWDEYKYGRDEADFNFSLTAEGYLDEANETPKSLIRYYYGHREDMFDSHSYGKGALVWHMLRNYLGDDAFFAGLNVYLKDKAFQSVELADVRLAFEKVTGEDLLWFFDQWFLFPGHPVLKVDHMYKSDTLYLNIEQVQNLEISPTYRLPMFVTVWENGTPQEYPLIIEDQKEIYKFPLSLQPDLVLMDSEHQLLGEIEHAKSDEELLFQFRKAQGFTPKIEVLDKLQDINTSMRNQILELALVDSFYVIRQTAVDYLNFEGVKAKKFTELAKGMVNDESAHVRAAVVSYLGETNFSKHEDLVNAALNDPSYMVIGAAINAFLVNEKPIEGTALGQLEKESNIQVVLPLAEYFSITKTEGKYDWFAKNLANLTGNELFYFVQSFAKMLIDAPQAERVGSVDLFDALARKHTSYVVRLSAYQALMLLSDIRGVRRKLEEIKREEKDSRLLELYNQM